MSDGTNTWNYTYNSDGMRIKRTDGTNTYEYVYNGSQLVAMFNGENVLYFSYDGAGRPFSVTYNGEVYYYLTNTQGDVIYIVTDGHAPVVSYTYDAWGNVLSISYSMASTLGVINPIRYRGYVYDQETGLYYLQSRYYNPEWGRFINADAYVATGQGFVGNNMFAYCINNPINFVDKNGKTAEALQLWSGSMWWLGGVDTVLPIGDAIYVGVIIVLGAITLATSYDSTPAVVFDEADTTYGSPSPNNNNDDDDDDDYYDDDSNFGGRQKVGKSKGNTPGNNQRQNKQFKDATKGQLSKDKQRALHDEISGEGFGFQEIVDAAKNLWLFFIGLFVNDD